MKEAPVHPTIAMRIARDLHVLAYVLLLATVVIWAVRHAVNGFGVVVLLIWYGLIAWGCARGIERVRPRGGNTGHRSVAWHGVMGMCLLQGLVYLAATFALLRWILLGGSFDEVFATSPSWSGSMSLLLAAVALFQGPVALGMGVLVRLRTQEGQLLATALWLGALPFLAECALLLSIAVQH